MTVLDVAKECARRLSLPVPSTFVTNTSNNMVLMRAIMNTTLDDLRDDYDWPELQKQHLFTTINGLENYALPLDYDRRIDETLWNRSQNWPLIGPVDPILWQQYLSGFITTLPRQRFSVKSWSNSQFFVNPTPTETNLLVYNYITKSTIRPITWAPLTAYALNAYVSYDGLILKCTANGTSGSPQPPAFGKDGTVFWQSVPAYVASISYYYGQYVYANSKVYQCTVAGKGGAAPSHTSGSATTGTCTFLYIATPDTWVGGTEYAQDDFVKSTGGGTDCYLALVGGVSGDYSPKFRSALVDSNIPLTPTTDTITDGTVTWTVYYQSFTTPQADTDEIILNNDMVTDGIVWRFLQARRLAYDDLMVKAMEKVEACKTKLEGTQTLSVSNRPNYPWAIGYWSYPEGSYSLDD